MNNKEGRGRSRKRRGGSRGAGPGFSSEHRASGSSRQKEGEQRSRQDKDPLNPTADSLQPKERRNNRGGRSRAKDPAKDTTGRSNTNGFRGLSKKQTEEEALMREIEKKKQAEEDLLRAEKEEEERIEAQAKEAERKEAERIEFARKEADRIEAERKEREELAAKAAELSKKRGELRLRNQSYSGESPETSRISEADLRKLDSSLKKCTGFIRKLRGSGITEDSHKSLLTDVRNLNLSRYISEVVTAISECKLRSSDTDFAAVVCSELHQRFEDFSSQLSGTLSSVVLSTHPNASKDLPTRRGAMRLMVELFVLGMHPDVQAITSVLRELMKPKRESRESAMSNLNVVSSFVRAVSRTLLVNSSTQSSEDPVSPSWEDDVAPLQTKQPITTALESYYKVDATRLYMESRNELREAENATLRARQTKGSVDDACAAKHESARQTCERIYSACLILAEALRKEQPIPISDAVDGEDANKNKAGDGSSGFSVVHGRGANAKARDLQDFDNAQETEPLFDSEEDRAFYNDLPNSTRGAESPLSPGSGKADSIIVDVAKSKDEQSVESKPSPAESTKPKLESAKVEAEKSVATGRTMSSRKKGDKNPSLDHLLARLGATETRENADRFTYQFINVAENSRKATQRLSKSLIAVSPQKLNVLPAYSRIAASLRSVYPEVASNVAENLEKEFRIFADRTDLDDKTLASCIKTARYLGEYCKFRMVDYETIFGLLSFCIKDLDFSGHRIDMTCHLLVTCGRMIYRTPASSLRMGNLLDTVWRLKSVKNLEQRHNTLVETAFHAARPSSGIKLQRHKIRPPLHEYVRRLIYTWLAPETVKWTALQLKRLPWDDELEQYIIKKFVKVSRMRFSTIPEVALLIAAVGKYRKEVLVGVVDGILEAIRSGMERNDGRDAQRRVSEVALLGELYNAHVISEKVIFSVLYQFITLGHEFPLDVASDKSMGTLLGVEASGINLDASSPSSSVESGAQAGSDQLRRLNGNHFYLSAPDPPKDYFRIRLACTLTEACGRTLLREKRRKVQVFWALFERYVFCKAIQSGLGEQLPLHVDHIVSDAFERMTRREDPTGASDQSRRPLTEANSRIRIRTREMEKREKRAALIAKAEGEIREEKKWIRCKNLEEAIKSVEEIEKSTTDCALITIPVRIIPLPLSPASRSQNKEGCSSVDGVSDLPLNKDSLDIESAPDNIGGEKTKDYDNVSESSPDMDDVEDSDSDGGLSDELIEDEDDEDDEEANEDDVEDTYDDGSLQSDFDDDDMDDDEEDEDDEEDDMLIEKERPKTEEEEMFEKELAAFTAMAVQTARESPSRLPTLNRMAIPMGLMAQKLAEERAAAAAAAAELNGENIREDSKGKKKRPKEVRVGFKFLVRKGGKSQIQDLSVPATSSLAVAARESETAGAAVQEEKKRLVLESSIVVNGDDDDSLDQFVPLRTQQDARAKEQSIKEQRTADEMALLSTLFRHKPRR